jgi:hypothetical protein
VKGKFNTRASKNGRLLAAVVADRYDFRLPKQRSSLLLYVARKKGVKRRGTSYQRSWGLIVLNTLFVQHFETPGLSGILLAVSLIQMKK